MNVAQESFTLSTGKNFAVNFALVNKGTAPVTDFTVDVTELGSWGKVMGMEVPSMLNPGESYQGYAYLTLAEDAQTGVHNFRLNVRSKAGLVSSKMLSVTVTEATAPETTQPEEAKATGFLANKSKLFWIVGDIVLIILAVLFLRLVFKK